MKDTEKEFDSLSASFSEVDSIDYDEDDAIGIHPKKKARPSVTGGNTASGGNARSSNTRGSTKDGSTAKNPASQKSSRTVPTQAAKPQTSSQKAASAREASQYTAKTKPTQTRPNAVSRPASASRPVQEKQSGAGNKTPATRPTAYRPQEAKHTASPNETERPQNTIPSLNKNEAPRTIKPADRAKAPSIRPATRSVRTIRSIPRPAETEEDDDILAHRSAKAVTPELRSRGKRKLTAWCIVRRSLLVFFTVIFFVVGVLLAVCNTLANGPSQTARDKAVMSALQASATKWVPGLFLSDEVVEQIKADSAVVITDVKPITDISSGDNSGEDAENRWANAIDGMIYENVNGTTFKGYVLLIKDPSRISVGISSDDFKNATMGMRIFEMADKYNAIAAINAGEFRDDGGMGTGYAPMGLTYSAGECVWNDGLERTFMGFDENDRLFVGEGTTYAEAEEMGMRDAVSFQTGNVLITNDGENVTYYYADSNTGVAQRTAIGQCADGTVIFLVTDGRTASSMGATRNEIIDTLVSYGAVTAGMLDGGSSSMLYYRDYYTKYNIDKNLLDEYQLMGLVNKYKAFTNPRRIPTYFIVK